MSKNTIKRNKNGTFSIVKGPNIIADEIKDKKAAKTLLENLKRDADDISDLHWEYNKQALEKSKKIFEMEAKSLRKWKKLQMKRLEIANKNNKIPEELMDLRDILSVKWKTDSLLKDLKK